jgi:hypothetical protein
VRDWQYWVSSNPNYARQTFPGVLAPMGHVFMGRCSELPRRPATVSTRSTSRTDLTWRYTLSTDS